MSRIAIDIGGTNMRVATCTESGIGPIARMRTPQDPADALEELAALMHGSIEGIVCGVAGIVEEGRIVTATNLPEWNGYHLANELLRVTRARTEVVNDAELAALGEAIYGAGKEMSSVAYLGIGTGVGTAQVVAGTVVQHSSDGEMRSGIITLADGQTLEECISGHALEKKYGKNPEDIPSTVWKELTPLLAEGIVNAIRLWSPDVVVLGGSLMNEENGFHIGDTAKAVAKLSGNSKSLPLLMKAALGDAAGLHGARALLFR